MSRVYCAACQLPQTACLCAYVRPQPCPMPVIIYQHPLEAKHAKSTVPLLRLGLQAADPSALNSSGLSSSKKAQPSLTITVAEQLPSPPPLASGDWWLLYPDAQALDLDAQQGENLLQAKKDIGGLIVLDGTWRKTRLLLHLNPWLSDLPKLTFSEAAGSLYAIRKGPGGQALSTLESVSHVLNRLHPEFMAAPLHDLLAARVAQFQGQAAAKAEHK